ncbi:MAG: helix-turn-helix domain-containing protein [Holophaga sp.]|nr:helix-turn-helix domain-containing protein [Holophaga sp.]
MKIEPIVPEVQGWDTIETQEFYTLREVGKILRMSKKHVYQRLIRRKVKVGGKVQHRTRLRHHQDGPGAEILVRHRDLLAYVEAMAVNVDPEMEGKKP